MKPIINIKEGLWVNLATMAFLVGLAAFAKWLGHHSQMDAWFTNLLTWAFAGIMILCCYFPIDGIRHPKERALFIEGDEIIWRIRGLEGGDKGVQEERLPLHQIRCLQFVIPRDSATHAKLLSSAELFFVTRQGGKRELPLDFFPGVFRDQIVAAVRERVPDVQVEEVDDAA